MCFAWNRLHSNLWVIFNASKCVVINRIKSPFDHLKWYKSYCKGKTGHLILLGSTSNVLASGGAVEEDFFVKGKERFCISWSLLIDFTMACCLSSDTCCHLAFFPDWSLVYIENHSDLLCQYGQLLMSQIVFFVTVQNIVQYLLSKALFIGPRRWIKC